MVRSGLGYPRMADQALLVGEDAEALDVIRCSFEQFRRALKPQSRYQLQHGKKELELRHLRNIRSLPPPNNPLDLVHVLGTPDTKRP